MFGEGDEEHPDDGTPDGPSPDTVKARGGGVY
jgi:hypothetical protein